ncbi:hypothetical protein C8Q75DRAFT_742635 [Abortiporus biennis]|nr:hypothetical protein C8Q75DRAFT_742635 [Abortiporus biennis]
MCVKHSGINSLFVPSGMISLPRCMEKTLSYGPNIQLLREGGPRYFRLVCSFQSEVPQYYHIVLQEYYLSIEQSFPLYYDMASQNQSKLSFPAICNLVSCLRIVSTCSPSPAFKAPAPKIVNKKRNPLEQKGYGFIIVSNATLERKAEEAYVPLRGMTWEEADRAQAIQVHINRLIGRNKMPWARSKAFLGFGIHPDAFGIYWRTNFKYPPSPVKRPRPNDEGINDQDTIAKFRELFDIPADIEPRWFVL